MIKQIFDKIKSNNLLKRSIVTLLLRVLGVATLFGFTWFLTNNFEEKVIGEYETIRTFLLVMGSVALLGTEQSIFYYAGKYQALGKTEALENIYFKMLQLILMSSVVIGIIYFFLPKSLI
ncbi:MAG: polysaccharide biosynthesis protein, partial [Myroides sp.]|nr:polysaccharide biosynthesis protein [Myroides sp.]